MIKNLLFAIDLILSFNHFFTLEPMDADQDMCQEVCQVSRMSRRWRCSSCCPGSSLHSSQSSWQGPLSNGQINLVPQACDPKAHGICLYTNPSIYINSFFYCVPRIVFLLPSPSLTTRGVPLSKSPGNNWSFTWVGYWDLETCPLKENSASSKDTDFFSRHQCFPLN